MLDYLSIAISMAALVFAIPFIPGIERARLAIALFALGCGQIHLAAAAYGLFLLVESRWRIEPGLSNFAWLWGFLLLLGIGVTTAVLPTTGRTYVELAQLALYVVLALLTMNYLRTGEHLLRFLVAAVIASMAVTVLALVSVALGLQSPPFIFLARGSNEGAVFLSLLGVVPAAVLFVRSRNPVYAVPIALFAYAQYIATARGSLIVSALTVLTAMFFLTRSVFVRAVLVAAGLYLLITSLPMLTSVYESNLNFSARERLALSQYAWWLWEQRPITGFGWGSTTYWAERVPTTELVYPHFHNAYVQLLVEAGIVGWAIIGTFLIVSLRLSYLALVRYRESALSMMVVTSFIALAVSGFFDAMLYGADRAIEVVILLSLMTRGVKLASDHAALQSLQLPIIPGALDQRAQPTSLSGVEAART